MSIAGGDYTIAVVLAELEPGRFVPDFEDEFCERLAGAGSASYSAFHLASSAICCGRFLDDAQGS
jgi:hypothetical protein